MLQTKNGVNVAEILTRIADELTSIRASLGTSRPAAADPFNLGSMNLGPTGPPTTDAADEAKAKA